MVDEQAELIPAPPEPEPEATSGAKAEAAEKQAAGVPVEPDEVKSRKEAVLEKMQALIDAKIAAAHDWASKQGGFPGVKLTLEELEEVFK